MKKGQVAKGRVTEVKFPDKAVVECQDGTRCIVRGGLPGQVISFMVTKGRENGAKGRMLEVLEPGRDEVESQCPHFGQCGGCSYQNLSYEAQLALKEAQVGALLAPVLERQEGDCIVEPIRRSPAPYGYRNKMEFSFGDSVKGGPLELGLHKRGSFYDIITVSDCQIVDGDFREIRKEVLAFFRGQQVSFYHRLRHTGYLRHLLVRKAAGTGEILIALVTTTQERRDLSGLCSRLLELDLEGEVAGILHVENDSVSDAIKNDRTVILYGRDYFYEELLGLKFKITPFSFFQTNTRGAEVLYETVRRFIRESRGDGADGAGQVIFDLYSGTGTIAQVLSPVARKVIGVEIVEEAVFAARENAKLNGLHNCEFLAGDVLQVLDTIAEKPDLVILDPPRDGIHPKALEKIGAYIKAKRMIYISCKPTSLARDLAELQKYGYQVERVCCVDMFPGTGHVETIVKLVRK